MNIIPPAFILLNLLAFSMFWSDKRRAIRAMRRIRESHLLLVAALGGSVGAVAGQKLLRHKTRKQPFGTYLQIIIWVQIGLIAAFLFAR